MTVSLVLFPLFTRSALAGNTDRDRSVTGVSDQPCVNQLYTAVIVDGHRELYRCGRIRCDGWSKLRDFPYLLKGITILFVG